MASEIKITFKARKNYIKFSYTQNEVYKELILILNKKENYYEIEDGKLNKRKTHASFRNNRLLKEKKFLEKKIIWSKLIFEIFL